MMMNRLRFTGYTVKPRFMAFAAIFEGLPYVDSSVP